MSTQNPNVKPKANYQIKTVFEIQVLSFELHLKFEL
jgi:hypothetical protein